MPKLGCLVIMPFHGDFDAIYEAVQAAATHAVPGEEIDCHWLKDVRSAGIITDDILEGLQKSAVCISDVTGSNPNVMWETGYAMALGKPTILIGQDVESLPFDLKVHRVLRYTPTALTALSRELSEALRQTMARYDVGRTSPPPASASSQMIAVTGTMVADVARVHRRIETVLGPYLGRKAVWYCGSNGVVDESVLDFLMQRDEQVVVVGYHRFDFSDRIRDLIQKKSVAFLDASVEALPRGMSGPNEREVLFATRADLVIVFWDGKSHGTGQALEYFQQSSKNLLVSFI